MKQNPSESLIRTLDMLEELQKYPIYFLQLAHSESFQQFNAELQRYIDELNT